MHKSLNSREMEQSEIERVEKADTRGKTQKLSGGDALRGNTRSHPEHDG